MELAPLRELFKINNGNRFNLANMTLTEKSGVNFIGRSEKNLGVVAQVEVLRYSGKVVVPFEKGLITVALGGSVLSAYIQPKDFYTGQNIKVLDSKGMTFNEKLYYCLCIVHNRYKYSTYGREANKSLDDLLVPKVVPSWVANVKLKSIVKTYFTAFEQSL